MCTPTHAWLAVRTCGEHASVSKCVGQAISMRMQGPKFDLSEGEQQNMHEHSLTITLLS